MPREITPATSLDNLKKEAKRWLKAIRSADPDAVARFARAHPKPSAAPGLRDVQHALAREHGHDSWIALTHAIERSRAIDRPAEGARPDEKLTAAGYERLANDHVQAYDSQDQAALDRLNAHYRRRSYTLDDFTAEIWGRVYAFRQRRSRVPKNYLQLSEAQMMVAQSAGYSSWEALIESLVTGAPPLPAYVIEPDRHAIAPRRHLNEREWDELIAVMKERRVAGLMANGMMTDALMARVADLDHVTALAVGGSRQLTDEGMRHLARMPQLQFLNLGGCKITDRGLEVLQHLPGLRAFEMNWQGGVSDAGIVHLRHCHQLERVDLMGSSTGDGAIEALQGKPTLRSLATGTLVTDASLPLLHQFPAFQTWRGEETRLLLDGPFTNAGLASLAGLDGVSELDLFWHVTGITTDGFAHLAKLPNLASLGADSALSDNVSMRHFAAFPRLRKLRAQGAVATDDGFEALSRSQTLEEFWGRQCPNFASRGFVALSRMPALRSLGVSLKQVDQAALSTLPDFPSLRQLTPIDVTDDGFRHVGRCLRLEHLSCMYCRETTDIATEHISGLGLRSYYAGLTKITDRSLEILGRMTSLERIEFYECLGVTDAGLPFLAVLPNLRQVDLSGLPGVTLAGTRVFPAQVHVRYST
jgi:hypothetical protein